MRLLHARHDDQRNCLPEGESRSRPKTRSAWRFQAISVAAPGYVNIVKAIQYAAAKLAAGG